MSRKTGEELFGTLYESGVVVARQGDHGDTMYVIQSGMVEVVQEAGGTETILARLEKGEFFGEMALLGDFPRTATVRTVSRCRLLPITRTSLLERSRKDTSVAVHLLEIVSRRIAATNRMLSARIENDDDFYRAFLESGYLGECELPLGTGASRAKNGKESAIPPNRVLLSFIESYGRDEIVSLDPGEILFKEGDPGDLMYVILSGKVRIRHGEGRNKHTLAVLSPEDVFGEIALVTRLPRSATAEAMEAAELVPVAREAFLDRMGREPALALYLLQLMIIRLQRTLAMMVEPGVAREFPTRPSLAPVKVVDPLRISLVSLSSCSGCMVRLLEEKRLDEMLSCTVIVYSPLLIDQDEIVPCDIALVDGAVRVTDDIETLRTVREKARYIAAWGTCAVMGGIPFLANHHSIEDLIRETFDQAQDTFGYYLSGGNSGNKTVGEVQRELSLLRRTSGLESHVQVDYYIPGCPPDISLLSSFLEELSGQPASGQYKKIVCSQCKRKAASNPQARIRVFPGRNVKDDVCFTSQGIMCLGFLTAGMCGAACPSGGLPCWGCRGLSTAALNKLSRGDSLEQVIIEGLARRFRIEYEEAKLAVNVSRNRGNSPLNFEPWAFIDRDRVR